MHSLRFTPLASQHFPLILKWFNLPHVSQWYEPNVAWDLIQIHHKYDHYTRGLTEHEGILKAIHAHVIFYSEMPIGYIQHYNAHDFLDAKTHVGKSFPLSLAGLDLFIGEPTHLGKGLSQEIIKAYLERHVFDTYDYVMVDPVPENKRAIHVFQKAGFDIWQAPDQQDKILMLQCHRRLAEVADLERKLLCPETRQSEKALDGLLAHDFMEFGASGEIHVKKDILKCLPLKAEWMRGGNMVVRKVAMNLCLVTYTAVEENRRTLRSSLWRKDPTNRWQMIFHQGTKVGGQYESSR